LSNQHASNQNKFITGLPQEPIVQLSQFDETKALEQALSFQNKGQNQKAEQLFKSILKHNPNNAEVCQHLGILCYQTRRPKIALNLMEKAIMLNPSMGLYHTNFAEMLRSLRFYDKALTHAKKGTELAPNLPVAHGNLGAVYFAIEEYDMAESAHRKALSLNPNFLPSLTNLGSIYSLRGDIDKAKEIYEKTLLINPHFIEAHYKISNLKKYSSDDPHLSALKAIEPNVTQLENEAQIKYHFAIGKAYNDIKEYSLAFDQFKKANELAKKKSPYDVSYSVRKMEKLCSSYTKEFVSKKCSGISDPTPIFIVGMPRSGTSLIEQVLSVHSKVYAAGELNDLSQVLLEVSGLHDNVEINNDLSYMDWLSSVDDQKIQELGQRYIERLRNHSEDALYITDKLPGNFYFLGLIHKALPDAKIIHAVRNPYDVCVSNYSRLYVDGVAFSYSLEDIAQFYNGYKGLMAHWKNVLPPEKTLDVHYEDMVENFDQQVKRILDFCGLNWEDELTEFYKHKRMVKTASTAQVLQPIYKGSVEKWKRYESELQPFINLVKENV
jgi:tetratricopeptide (TPR) repeat protein